MVIRIFAQVPGAGKRFPSCFSYLIGCSLLLSGCSVSSPHPAPPPPAAPQPQLQTWTNTLSGIPITMVGTDPTKAAAGTTQVPVVIIPIGLKFNGGAITLSPDESACGDSVSALARLSNSPVFQNLTWTDDTGFEGTTQFADAFQRANFSKYIGSISPDYHVLLAPITVLPTVFFDTPVGSTIEANPACANHSIGGIPIALMDTIVRNLVGSNHITPDTLPIFVTYDIKFLRANGEFFLGYHNNIGPQTYIVTSYSDTFDITTFSHEIAEWLDNPFLTNIVSPAWGDLNPPQKCDNRIEVGDPLEGSSYSVMTPAFTYHVQELAYFSWFARDVPSIAFNGSYSTRGSFVAPASPCP